MFPKIDPKKMQAMMKQMGINQEQIDAERVIIEKENENIIINNPNVVKVNMQGQTNYQITGDISIEEIGENKSEEDIKTIIEKTEVSEEEAKEALKKADGDLTDALLSFD